MRALAITLGLVVGLGAATAGPAEDAALLHLERGIAAFEAGDFARAHRELLAAHELAPDRANPYRWLALTEVQLGDCASARRHIAGFLERVAPGEPRVAEMVRLRELCKRDRADGVDPRATGPAPRPRAARPLYRRWWFWPVVAGVAATGVGVGLVLAGGDDDGATVLPPIRCDLTGCQGGSP